MAATGANSPKAAVFWGDKLIELEDPSIITLEDICEAFGVEWSAGTFIKEQFTGRPVVTLPFEKLPKLEVAESGGKKKSVKAEEEPSAFPKGTEDTTVKEEPEEEEEEDPNALPYQVLYEFCIDGTLKTEAVPAAEEEEVLNENSGGGEENNGAVKKEEKMDEDSDNSDEEKTDIKRRIMPSISNMAMKRLVELGAVELITPGVVSSTSLGGQEYSPKESPGLVRRIIYPPSQYSPCRTQRDPLAVSRTAAVFRKTGAVGSGIYVGSGGTYTSFVETYHPHAPSPGEKRAREDLVRLTDEELGNIFA